MDFDEFKNKIIHQCKEMNIAIDEQQAKRLYTYMNLMIEWNKKINLTAITEPEQVITKHFVDSLSILKYINKDESIIDVGTGAGFPSIPIKIMNSDNKILLLDALNKRIKFLDLIIDRLQIKDIHTVHIRAEEAGKDSSYREKYDIATSRAVAPMTRLAEYLLPFVKKGGKCICMKGSNVADELRESEEIITQLGGKIVKVDNIKLPSSDFRRNIIIIKKTNNTPKQYPRQANRIRQN